MSLPSVSSGPASIAHTTNLAPLRRCRSSTQFDRLVTSDDRLLTATQLAQYKTVADQFPNALVALEKASRLNERIVEQNERLVETMVEVRESSVNIVSRLVTLIEGFERSSNRTVGIVQSLVEGAKSSVEFSKETAGLIQSLIERTDLHSKSIGECERGLDACVQRINEDKSLVNRLVGVMEGLVVTAGSSEVSSEPSERPAPEEVRSSERVSPSASAAPRALQCEGLGDDETLGFCSDANWETPTRLVRTGAGWDWAEASAPAEGTNYKFVKVTPEGVRSGWENYEGNRLFSGSLPEHVSFT